MNVFVPGSEDGKANVNVDTNADAIEKPMLQNGPNEEIGNCPVRSGDISIDDMESLEGNEMKILNHKVDTKIQNKEENGEDHENKCERLAEKEDASNNNLGNTYSANIVKKATTGSYCEKCEVNFKSKINFRRHLIKSMKQMHMETVMSRFVYGRNQKSMYTNFTKMKTMMIFKSQKQLIYLSSQLTVWQRMTPLMNRLTLVTMIGPRTK